MVRAATTAKNHVVPLFPPILANATTQALSVLLLQVELRPPIGRPELEALTAATNKLVDCVIDGHGTAYDLFEPISLRDHYHAHPLKVAELSMLVTRIAGGKRSHMRNAGLAALLMNIGYTKFTTAAIEQSGPLNDSDLTVVNEHPTLGVASVEHGELDPGVTEAIAQHHERWDGSGYPHGLAGKEISTLARVIGAADVFVAMCSPRTHRGPRATTEVIEHFRMNAGTLFDPVIVRAILDEIPRRYDT
jgi:HD-GYP domain-containing protein (c-di-GMP phosphodiesterase class II)